MRCRVGIPARSAVKCNFQCSNRNCSSAPSPSMSPSSCRPCGMQGGMGRLSGAQRLLPKGTLHFSAIYCVYPQPRRMALTYLRYLESARSSLWFKAVAGAKGTSAGVRGHGGGGTATSQELSHSWVLQACSTLHGLIPPVPQPPELLRATHLPLQSHMFLPRVCFLTAPQGAASARGASNSSKHRAQVRILPAGHIPLVP